MRFVLLGGEKDRLFFIGPHVSTAAPEKEKLKGLIYWHVMTYRLLLAACHDVLKNQVML